MLGVLCLVANTKTSIYTEHETNVVIQQKSRRLLTMDVLISETC